ncbi:RNA-binding S4 domain-containing protein [Traorella massiliensis]|uniref:RNA-binding S4 domain-containing protein n=1 Tax=Traorella massiliensis TaxID=1903263 RepID=UPI0008F8107D|nr:RNA-binding S4 domain-containing protein [Traorella massiliensis]
MRLDKYLKVARISKRRAIGKELADNQRVLINGRIAKPSSEVKENDILTIYFGQKELTIRVLMLAKQVSKQQANLMFEVIEEKKREEDA